MLKKLLLILFFSVTIFASGGPLKPEQAAYDVKTYELNLKIDPDSKTISGNAIVKVKIVNTINKIVLDFHNNYTISSISAIYKGNTYNNLTYTYTNKILTINFADVLNVNEEVKLQINYSGKPANAVQPPWDYGFVWKKTKDNNHWVGIAGQSEGADYWFPCKDHPSDLADSVIMNFTVPSNLTCVANGIEKGTTNIDNNWKTFHWLITNPINNYNITFYIGPYDRVDYDYTSVTGEKIPFSVWVLKEKDWLLTSITQPTAKQYTETFTRDMQFLEKICGPYPFRGNKYGVVHAPYYGMEHSTAIAYGASFSFNPYKFDYLHFHELCHEWWGNLISCSDWKDAWIHEGFATYMEALYAEELAGPAGKNAYHNYTNKNYRTGPYPVAYKEATTAGKAFSNSSAIYYKGATILHGLRHLMGDTKFFIFLKKCTYYDLTKINVTDGSQHRYVDSDEIIRIANEVMQQDISWYFDIALYEYTAPILSANKYGTKLILKWDTPSNKPYNVPVEVFVNGQLKIANFYNNIAELDIQSSDIISIDPDRKTFRENSVYVGIEDNVSLPEKFDLSAYPNPFNSQVNIEYTLTKQSEVEISLYNLIGENIKNYTLSNKSVGKHFQKIDFSNLAGGVYLCSVKAKSKDSFNKKTVKLIYQK